MRHDAAGSSWRDAGVAHAFLDNRRRAIPFADEQVAMMIRLTRRFAPGARRVADLGCGDGLLARALLAEFPAAEAVLVDHSEPMLERARAAMGPVAGRCRIVAGDLAGPLAGWIGEGPFDVVASGFAIHHLPTPRKRSLYAEVFGVLAPGGLFVNVEHVASATPAMESVFDAAYIDNLAHESGRDRAEVEAEYHSRADKADNILEPVEAQVAWLREIGFAESDCYFKWLELAVFGGVKPDRAG